MTHPTLSTAIFKIRRQWDRVSMYLPILLMGALALVSYWVLHSAPSVQPSSPSRPPKHEPDYIMRDFSVRTFGAEGQLKSQINGKEGRHYPDTDTTEVDHARIRAVNQAGHLITAQGNQLTTNGEQTEHLLRGQVVAVREAVASPDKPLPRLEYRGEQMRIFTDTDRIESSLPVEMLRGTDRITADTLHYSDQEQIANLQGRVRATLQPKR